MCHLCNNKTNGEVVEDLVKVINDENVYKFIDYTNDDIEKLLIIRLGVNGKLAGILADKILAEYAKYINENSGVKRYGWNAFYSKDVTINRLLHFNDLIIKKMEERNKTEIPDIKFYIYNHSENDNRDWGPSLYDTDYNEIVKNYETYNNIKNIVCNGIVGISIGYGLTCLYKLIK